MIILSTILFAIAALLGVFLISYVFQKKETPKGVAFTHGSIAALGLLLLIVYAILHSHSPLASIILFIIAALGGFLLIFRDLTGKSVPAWMAGAHGIIAIIGFVFLLIFIFT